MKMKSFVIQSIAAAGLLLAVDVTVVAARVALAQKDVADAFAVPPETVAVFIGNSHTGCTFTEAPEFRNRVVWRSSTGFMLHYLRFLELERRGAFDNGVRFCVLDCDTSALNRFTKEVIVENAPEALPYLWRYWPSLPFQKMAILKEVLSRPNCEYQFIDPPPMTNVPDWTTRTKDEKWSYLKGFYTTRGVRETQWESDAFPLDWQSCFYGMVSDMKARCAKRNIRLILVATPLASDNPDRTDPNRGQRITDLATRVRAFGVEYCDFRLACPDEKFRDAGHLLPRSSYEFTKRFYAEVLKIPD